MNKKLLFLLGTFFIILIPFISSTQLSFVANPGTRGLTYVYNISFTTDSACVNVVFSNKTIVTTDDRGFAVIQFPTPTTMSAVPKYLC